MNRILPVLDEHWLDGMIDTLEGFGVSPSHLHDIGFFLDLLDVANTNFGLEVAAMRQSRYPMADTHEDEHRYMAEGMQLFIDLHRANGSPSLGALALIVRNIFLEHLQNGDAHFGEWNLLGNFQ